MVPVINKKETGVNLRRIMDRCGITPKDVQQYLGLGCVQSVYRWLDGINVPTVDNLYALSELFKMPMDEILCGNRAQVSRPILLLQLEVEPCIGRAPRISQMYYEKSKEITFGSRSDDEYDGSG